MKISIAKDKKNIYDVLFINDKAVYSKYNPIKTIERQLDKILDLDKKIILVFGVGLGYHLQLIQNKNPFCRIIVFENNQQIYQIFKKSYQVKNTHVLFYNSSNEIDCYLNENLEFKDLAELQVINSYQGISEFESVFIEFNKSLHRVMDSIHKNFWTRYAMSELWNNNTIDNLKYIEKSFPVNYLFSKFKNVPAVIVCAGPSLRKSLEKLKKLENKVLIICVDTALRELLKFNCIPDIVVSLDAQKANFQDFSGIYNYDFLLLYELSVYPEILNWYKGDYPICSIVGKYNRKSDNSVEIEYEPLTDYIKNYISEIHYLQSGGSVSTNAFDLARNMECNPIIFIGQDLSYSEMKTHTDNANDMISFYNSLNKYKTMETHFFENLADKQVFSVPGNYNKFVLTDTTLKHYLNWLSDAAAIISQKVYNATEGGALIPNTIKSKLDEIPELRNSRDKTDIKNIIKKSNKIKFDKIKFMNDSKIILEKFQSYLIEIKNNRKILDECKTPNKVIEKHFKKFKNEILKCDFRLLQVYKNKYYLSIRQLKNLNENSFEYFKNDFLLFFVTFEYGINQIILNFQKILTICE